MLENNELTVRKANAFVQKYRVSLSLVEIRIVNYLIANIKSPKYDKKFQKFRFSIKEFCDIVYPDKKIGKAYKWLPDIVRKLSDKSAWTEVPSTDNPNKMKKVLIRWIERPEFEEGCVTLELNPYLAPYLLQLESSYFKSKFRYTIEARSKYTIPLYELLKSWEKIKDHTKKFDIDELRSYMDATEKSKDNFAEFKRRALEPAVREINEITDLQVEYEPIKRGRKVIGVEFKIFAKNNNNTVEDSDDFNLDEMYDNDFYEEIEIHNEQEINQKREILELFMEVLPDSLSMEQVDALQTIAREKLSMSDSKIPIDLQIYHLLDKKTKLMIASTRPVKKEYYLAWLKKAINEDWM